tara:strand:- start:237 stop:479 length:243 start_codon:yes stop_codon:yes gene_type:complete
MIETAKQHLAQSKMGYWKHLTHSLYNAMRLQWIVIDSIIHALFPMVFKTTAARGVVRIYLEMKKHAHLRKMINQEKTKQN